MKYLKKTCVAIVFVVLIATCFSPLKIQAATINNDKALYNCEIEIETANYDECVQALEQTINTYNAEIIEKRISIINRDESKQEEMRRSKIVLRVSNQNYHKCLERIGANGKVTMWHEKLLNAERNSTQDDSQSTICVTVQEISAVHDVSWEEIKATIKFSMRVSLLFFMVMCFVWFIELLLEEQE